jgi:hypothetical protein
MTIFGKLRESYWADLQREQEMETEQLIEKQLNRFDVGTEDGKKRLKEFVDRLADRRKNLHINPEFTPQVVGVCQQILAFGMAGLGLIVAFWSRLTGLTPFWQALAKAAFLVSLNLTAIAFTVLLWFFVQARSRYPFLFLERFGNAKPFFYYETLSRRWSYSPISSRRGIAKANLQYLSDLAAFTETMVDEDESLLKRARYELQQYFLLIAYQGYLDQYEMQLEHIFLYGSTAGLLAAAVVCRLLLF